MSIPQAPALAGSVVRALVASLLVTSVILSPGPAAAQVASQSVNMVSGIQWPGGDPFLQRQNEPSVAVSSRNPRHLLAGANDYRTVDIPFSTPNAPETGDAWLGVFKSFDGGITWRSTLLPGYPQQPGGPTGPLAGFSTAADPVVRAGTNGLFYYSGIAFNRDTKGGVVFVARFMDLNDKENGDPATNSDPIRYISTTVVDTAAPSAPFIDKPWIAVDKPRLLDGVCHLTVPQPLPGNPNATVSQTVPAGDVYAAWTEVSGTGSALTTNVFFSSSRDCGATFSQPVKLNGTNKVNQGASIAIDPATGVVYVVWRRLASGSQADAIMVTRSFRGLFFSTPSVVVSLPAYSAANPTAPSFFDQGTTGDSFRTTAYPTIGIDRRPDAGSENDDEPDTPTFWGKLFVAWSQRGIGPGGDARVVLSVSTDAGSSWSASKPVDNSSLTDDTGHVFSRGHQFMPQMTVTADKITIIYYDARFDHTFGLFTPSYPFLPDPVTGRFYLETRALKGELLDTGGTARVFTPFFVETGMTEWRHTLDLRFAQADAAVSPAFSSSRLSQYSFGTRGDEVGTIAALQQLQIDPPNLRLFQQGSVPFIGDYIDVAGPMFLPPATPGGRWRFNSLPGTSPVFLAAWTSNQDVRPPLDGDWTHYTPPGSKTTGVKSVFNPAFTTPACVPGNEGMRNQNIYAARIAQGLAVTSVQNAKPLSSTLQRDLALNVENLTPLERTFRLTISGQPTGGRASFVPAPNPLPKPLPAATTTLDVVIPANSAVARSVYALSTDAHARIEVDVAEVNGAPGSALKTNGLTGFVIFNTDPSAPTLIDPDNNSAGSVTTVEIYNPNVSNPNVSNPNVSNPNVSNPNVSNPNVSNPNVSNPNVSNPNVSNPDLANPNVSNPNVSNPNVSNPNVSNAPVSDATYTVTNTGNTASTYRIQLVGTAPSGTPLQLIITKPYANPASLNCVLFEQQHNIPVANVLNPEVISPGSAPGSGITDPSDGNATFILGPGESILVTIRAPVDVPTLTNIIQNLAPVVVAHAPNTNDTTNQPATSPPAITTSALPDGVAGQAFSAPITALGGRPPYTWTATGLPANLSISGTTVGLISGTPSATGTFSVGVSVKDSASKTGSHTYTLRIWSHLSITTASLPNGTVGVGYSQPLAASGGLGTYTWSLASGSLPPGVVLSAAGVLAGTPAAGGTYSFTVKVTDSAAPAQSVTQNLTLTIAAPVSLLITSAPTNVVGGQPFAISVNVKDGSGSPIVGASVSLSFATRGCLGGLGATLSGTLSALTGATGDAAFPGVLIDRGGPGFTLRATFGVATAVTGPIFVEGFCTTGNLTPSRYDITLTKLADGRVLLTGGIQPGSTNIFNTAVVYDASTGQFTPVAGSMTTTRAGHRAVLLPSGKVLLVGGFSGPLPPGPPLLTAELFDPLSQTFALTAGLPGTSRSSFRAIWVPGISKVLIVGGSNGVDLASAELYDPATDAFSPTNPMATPRSSHTADLLPDGRILVVGGFSGSATLATAEIWDPTTGTFTPTGSLHSPRASHASATLPDGRVLVAGGVSTRGGSALATAEIYDPVTATFTPAAAMTAARSEPLLSVLPSGKVLVASGWDAANATLTSAELFDPVSGVFTSTGSSWAAHTEGEAVLLSTGNVLVAGGWTGFGAADLFFPLPPTVFLVTNTADAGAGSLRQAILDANAHAGLDAIHFAIPGSGVQTISPASALPVITDPVLLDATTQPGYAGTPLVRLDGVGLSGPITGIPVTAGNSLVQGFMVTRFPGVGIELGSATATRVADNYVGSDGATPLGNIAGGIFVTGGSGNTVEDNVVSGNNVDGIVLRSGANGSVLQNNRVGTNATGTAALPNNGWGIRIYDSTTSGNTVRSNLASGNVHSGIYLHNGAHHNTVARNLVGSNAQGTGGIHNESGVMLTDGAHDNMIGGIGAGDGNVILGNTNQGIYLAHATTTGNVFLGNWIGTNATMATGLGNAFEGVLIQGASNNRVGGTAAGQGNVIAFNQASGVSDWGVGNQTLGNVISGNHGEGIRLDNGSSGARIAGNKIGTDPTGSSVLGNNSYGILITGSSSGNAIGGPGPAEGNVVSGNGLAGLYLAALVHDNVVENNRIGTNAAGNLALPNSAGGIGIIGGVNNTLRSNVVLGNIHFDGIDLGYGAIGNLVENNSIGINASGTATLGNHNNGVWIYTSNSASNTVKNNVISGSMNTGMSVTDGAHDNIVTENRIGTNAAGGAALGNAGDGILIGTAATANLITNNVIAGSDGGILLSNASLNTVSHNWVGTNAVLAAGLGNRSIGIRLYGSSNNLVGGGIAADGNVIAYNGAAGVVVDSGTGNAILSNSIFGNVGIGIDLGYNGITPNDVGDTDTGANDLINFPVLTGAVDSGSQTTVTGSVDVGNPGVTLYLQFFANDTCDLSGYGEGQTLVGTTSVVTGVGGTVSFAVNLPTGLNGKSLTATTSTLLGAGGNTSEFSACVTVTPSILWAQQFGSTADDFATGVAIDASGVYVTGYTSGTLPGQISAGGNDAFVRKYDLGGAEVWTRQFGTVFNDEAFGISVDASGVYVAGRTTGTLPGQVSAGGTDAFVRKYDLAGNVIWTRQFGTTYDDAIYGMSVDASGVYVAGQTDGTLSGQTSAGGYDAFVRKYDLAGNEVWTRQFGTVDGEYAGFICIDASGVYVAGNTSGALPGETSSGNVDAFVRKYDLSGIELWTRQFGTPGIDGPTAISIDASGVYVVGYTTGTLPGQTSAGGYDAFVRKYDLAGNELWTRQFGTSNEDIAYGISLDISGVYVTGYTEGTFAGQISQGARDVFVRKYDPAGSELWTRQFGSTGDDWSTGISVDASGMYISGFTSGTFSGQTSVGNLDAFITKLAN